jgi:uncharacterized membrane protein
MIATSLLSVAVIALLIMNFLDYRWHKRLEKRLKKLEEKFS